MAQVHEWTMRVAFTGGRKYTDERAVVELCETLVANGLEHACHGGAIGLDSIIDDVLVKMIGRERVLQFPANWSIGKRAGTVRNVHMLKTFRPDVLIHFPGGTGTTHCVRTAAALRVPTFGFDEVELILRAFKSTL